MTSNQNDKTGVVIQDRSRMFRDSLSLVLGTTFGFDSCRAVADGEALVQACGEAPASAVIFEAESVPWDVPALVSSLVRSGPERTMVGTFRGERPGQPGDPGVRLVTRTATGASFAALVEGRALDAAPDTEVSGSLRPHDTLTRREVQVLALISGGSTAAQIADRLGISIKTVENRKQALFAKLGVQNQSHAVAVAMRTGLLGPAAESAGVG